MLPPSRFRGEDTVEAGESDEATKGGIGTATRGEVGLSSWFPGIPVWPEHRFTAAVLGSDGVEVIGVGTGGDL